MYNKIITVGNLTRDIEMKFAANGTAIAKSSIATSHRYKTSSGEQKEETCFLEFTIFGKLGEIAHQYLRKGSKVMLEGRLVYEQWTAQDGSNRNRHSMQVSEMKMLDSKSNNSIEQLDHTKIIEPSIKEIELDIKDEDIPF